MTEQTIYQEYQEARKNLSPTQLARIMLKQKWEGRSALAVYEDWPSLFDPNRDQDDEELKACQELIRQRPDLFPTETDDA